MRASVLVAFITFFCVGKADLPIIFAYLNENIIIKSSFSQNKWLHNGSPIETYRIDKPLTFIYRYPVTDIHFRFTLPSIYTNFEVSWSYSFDGQILFDASNVSCGDRYICVHSSLTLLSNPGNRIFIPRVNATSNFAKNFEAEIRLYPYFSLISKNFDTVSKHHGRHLKNRQNISLDIILFAEKCSDPIKASCLSTDGGVDLYITTDFESLRRYNGSWPALLGEFLSLKNFSMKKSNRYFTTSYVFNSTEYLGRELYVVCHCLGRYSYKRLPVQNCATSVNSELHSPKHRLLLIACSVVTSLLMIIVIGLWLCLIHRRNDRLKYLQRRPSLIYQSIDAIESQSSSCPHTHEYANISIVHCSHRKVLPQSESKPEGENYLEPRTFGPFSHKMAFDTTVLDEISSHEITSPQQHHRKWLRSSSLSRTVPGKSFNRARTSRRYSVN